MRRSIMVLTAGALLASSAALADPGVMNSVPASSMNVTDWYKQDVYDPNNNRSELFPTSSCLPTAASMH